MLKTILAICVASLLIGCHRAPANASKGLFQPHWEMAPDGHYVYAQSPKGFMIMVFEGADPEESIKQVCGNDICEVQRLGDMFAVDVFKSVAKPKKDKPAAPSAPAQPTVHPAIPEFGA